MTPRAKNDTPGNDTDEMKPRKNAAGVKNKRRKNAGLKHKNRDAGIFMGNAARHINQIAVNMGVQGRKKAAFAAACLVTAVCLICFYVFFAGPRLDNLLFINGEITAKRRILDVKKINYSQMDQNKAELEALTASATRGDPAIGISSEIPDAVLNIAEMMNAYEIAEYNIVLSPGYEYGGLYRQPVSVSGKSALTAAYAFIGALEDGAYRYEITELTIRTENAGGVYLNISLDILVANRP